MSIKDILVARRLGGGGSGGDDKLRAFLTDTLTEIDYSEVTSIPKYQFMDKTALTSVKFPNATTVGNNAFSGCDRLESLSIPAAKTIGNTAISSCPVLRFVNVDSLEFVPQYCFVEDVSLERLVLPKVQYIEQSVFRNCEALNFVDLQVEHIETTTAVFGARCFDTCKSLDKLVIRAKTGIKWSQIMEIPVGLSNTSAFFGTPFASGGTGGKCFVPSSLIDDYQTATNWSTLYAAGTCVFYPLEDYTVDGTTTGELDWDKINDLYEGGAGE